MNVFINALVLALERQQPASCLLEGPNATLGESHTAERFRARRISRGEQ